MFQKIEIKIYQITFKFNGLLLLKKEKNARKEKTIKFFERLKHEHHWFVFKAVSVTVNYSS